MDTFMKLFTKFILLALPLILLSAFCFKEPMAYMSVEYPMWAEEKDAVRNLSFEKEPETVIIGDSRAKSSLIPEYLSHEGKVYNIAIGGATPVEMYHAAGNYLKSHEAPENAVLIFAPYHFCDMDNWDQTLYYNYLSPGEILAVEADAIKYGEEKMIYNGWIADLLSFRLRLPNKYLDQVYTARFVKNRAANEEKYRELRQALGYTHFGEEEMNAELNYETHHPEFDLSPMVDAYYIKLLDSLKDAGVNIIIEQAPVNEASGQEITEEFKKGYREYMDSMESRYPGSFVEKEIPVYDNSFFGDNNHLNRRGAEKFSKEIGDKHSGIF